MHLPRCGDFMDPHFYRGKLRLRNSILKPAGLFVTEGVPWTYGMNGGVCMRNKREGLFDGVGGVCPRSLGDTICVCGLCVCEGEGPPGRALI